MTDYPTVAEVLAMQAELINRFGGSHGVRDFGLLESALYRPQTGYYADLIDEAAALWESLSMNHPFIDGNKRIAFATTDIFLRMNGFHIKANALETYAFIDSLHSSGRFEHKQLADWLRANTVKLT